MKRLYDSSVGIENLEEDIAEIEDEKELYFALRKDGKALKFASKKLRNRKDMVLLAISTSNVEDNVIQYASLEVSRDEEIILKAVKKNGLSLQYLDDEIRNKPRIVRYSISQNGMSLEFASSYQRNDKTTVFLACTKDGMSLKFASESLRSDESIVRAARLQNPLSIQFAGKEFRDNKEICHDLVRKNGLVLEFLSDDLKNDGEIVQAALVQNIDSFEFIGIQKRSITKNTKRVLRSRGLLLEFAIDEHRNNFDVVSEAVENNGLAIQFASDELKKNEEIVKMAVHQNYHSLEYCDEELKRNKDFMIKLIHENPKCLEYANKYLRNDVDICNEAIQDGLVLQYCSEEMKVNKEFVEKACSRNGLALKFAPSFQDDRKIVVIAISNNGCALEFACKKLRDEMEIIDLAVSNNPEALQFTKFKNFYDMLFTEENESLLTPIYIGHVRKIQLLFAKNESIKSSVKYKMYRNFVLFCDKLCEYYMKKRFDLRFFESEKFSSFFKKPKTRKEVKDFKKGLFESFIKMYFETESIKEVTRKSKSFDPRIHLRKSCQKYFQFREVKRETYQLPPPITPKSPNSGSSSTETFYFGFWDDEKEANGIGMVLKVSKALFTRVSSFQKVFLGEFKDGRRNGEGREFDAKFNLRFFGKFKKGVREGKGIEYDESKVVVYEGLFKNGMRHGNGESFADGKCIHGIWESGKIIKVYNSFDCPILPLTAVSVHLSQEVLIGRGAFGIVYKMKSALIPNFENIITSKGIKNCEYVAVKVFNSNNSYEREMMFTQVKRAVEVCGMVDSKEHILDVACILKGSNIGIVMECCKLSVDTIIGSSHIQIKEKLRFLHETALGMLALHKKNIMHRDLKWGNVLVGYDGKVKICDFDCAKKDMKDYKFDVQHTGVFSSNGVGTAEFAAPEIASSGSYGIEVDVFSYGLMIYSILFEMNNPYLSQYQCQTCGSLRDDISRTDLIMHVKSCNFRPLIDHEKIEKIEKEYRFLVDLMILLKGWNSEPANRPSFNDIVEIYENEKNKKKCYSIVKVVLKNSKNEKSEKTVGKPMKVLLMKPTIKFLEDSIKKFAKIDSLVRMDVKGGFSLQDDEDVLKMVGLHEQPTVIAYFQSFQTEEDDNINIPLLNPIAVNSNMLRLEARIKNLEREMSNLKDENINLKEKCSELDDENIDLKKELDDYKKKVSHVVKYLTQD